ncbi:MAG: DUF4173 domain-containing protein, partial [Gemmatimonadetes bacterium]|nr:DUF4173 domain-containing protein [Gemmatimonadota bacterium]
LRLGGPRIRGPAVDLGACRLGAFASHVALTGILGWLACGYLAGFATGTRLDVIPRPAPPRIGIATAAVAVGLVDLLFVAFVQVQVQALFGGAAFVETTPGLSYAAYAREGFFQLVTATALGLSWLLAVDGLLGRREPVAAWTFRALAGVQLLLLLAIAASAVQRLSAYVDAYGLTEDRFVAVAALGWLAVLIVGFGATILRERRRSFMVLGLATAFVWVAGLQVANPAARSAGDLLDRHRSALESGSSGAAAVRVEVATLDAHYLTRLGSDAVPVLMERFAELPEPARCVVAGSLLREWGPERAADWRAWNASEARARRLVADAEARLRVEAPQGGETRCSDPLDGG